MQLHFRTIPSAYRHFVLALGIRRKSCRFIAAYDEMPYDIAIRIYCWNFLVSFVLTPPT